MSGSPDRSIAHNLAQSWSQCAESKQVKSAPKWGASSADISSYQGQQAFDVYQNTEDSDSSSQSSFQDSSSDRSDAAYSSPPSSIASDGETICDSQVDRGLSQQPVQQQYPTKAALQPNNYSTAGAIHDAASTFQYRKQDLAAMVQDVGSYAQSSTAEFSATTAQTERLSGSRRRGCALAQVLPKLKRDTDNTDAIVKMIVVFCTNLINSIWCPRPVNETSASNNSGAGVLPLQIFITETLRRSKTSYSTLQVALYYLIMLKECLPSPQTSGQNGQSGCRAMQCGRRMFLTALILASKYLQDRNYSARAWSKISGLPLKEINENERRYLSIICWDLHVPKDTFENWSKIVLAVCRLSNESEAGSLGLDKKPPGPGSAPSFVNGLQLHQMCRDSMPAKTWWSSQLRGLRTDIVKCPRQTDAYLSGVSPFRAVTPLLAPVLFDTTTRTSSPMPMETSSESTPRSLPRLPSIDRLHFASQLVERNQSPTPSFTLPPPVMLRNLPTPQTTPRFDMTSLWASSVCKPGLKNRASASVLSSLDRVNQPSANLETCPPPAPRSCLSGQTPTGCQYRERFQDWRSRASTPSITSSPESIVSDFSWKNSRSRSSSVSSSSSWMPTKAHTIPRDGQPSLRREITSLQEKLAAHRLPEMSQRPSLMNLRDSYQRPRTAFKIPSIDDEACETMSQSSQGSKFSDEGYGSDEYGNVNSDAVRQVAAAEALIAFHNRTESQTPTPRTYTGQPAYTLHGSKSSQQLKRIRSDSVDIEQLDASLSRLQRQQITRSSSEYWTSSDATTNDLTTEKETQASAQDWAMPRKPVLCGTQNKRIALQMPHQASSLAADYLKTSLLVS